jgi:hypothetical protein
MTRVLGHDWADAGRIHQVGQKLDGPALKRHQGKGFMPAGSLGRNQQGLHELFLNFIQGFLFKTNRF